MCELCDRYHLESTHRLQYEHAVPIEAVTAGVQAQTWEGQDQALVSKTRSIV